MSVAWLEMGSKQTKSKRFIKPSPSTLILLITSSPLFFPPFLAKARKITEATADCSLGRFQNPFRIQKRALILFCTITDVDECRRNKGGCHHLCSNRVGKPPVCLCRRGYINSNTNYKRCVGKRFTTDTLILKRLDMFCLSGPCPVVCLMRR